MGRRYQHCGRGRVVGGRWRGDGGLTRLALRGGGGRRLWPGLRYLLGSLAGVTVGLLRGHALLDGGLVTLRQPERQAEPRAVAQVAPRLLECAQVGGAPGPLAGGVVTGLQRGLGGADGEDVHHGVDEREVARHARLVVEKHGGASGGRGEVPVSPRDQLLLAHVGHDHPPRVLPTGGEPRPDGGLLTLAGVGVARAAGRPLQDVRVHGRGRSLGLPFLRGAARRGGPRTGPDAAAAGVGAVGRLEFVEDEGAGAGPPGHGHAADGDATTSGAHATRREVVGTLDGRATTGDPVRFGRGGERGHTCLARWRWDRLTCGPSTVPASL